MNIDIAVINVVPLIIYSIYIIIYLCVLPDITLISKFAAAILVCQVFNFDLLSTANTGLIGTVTDIGRNLVGLTIIPYVIETRKTNFFNMPLLYVAIFSCIIWLAYSVLIEDPCLLTACAFSLASIIVQTLFCHWAMGYITESGTPKTLALMQCLIIFFSKFTVQQGLRDIN